MKYQYYNPNILLLINSSGKIKKLYTPFRARCLVKGCEFKLNTIVYVDEVLSNEKDELQYSVSGEIYPYTYFELIVRF